MSASLHVSLTGIVAQAGAYDAPVKVSLDWSDINPAEIVLEIRHVDDDEPALWTIARTSLVVASQEFYRGAWAGGGNFAVIDQGDVIRFAFKPLHLPKNRWAFVRLPATPVREFIAHTNRLVPACSELESELTLRQVERAIAELLA